MSFNRFMALAQAAFGGAGIAAFGALVVAGDVLLALVPLVVGTVLLAAANRRVEDLERVVEILYYGGAAEEEEVYVDPFGPFGWMRAASEGVEK